MVQQVTIVVVGDKGTGKTSLITAAATDCFSDTPPPLLPPTRIPADSNPDGVPLTVLDTSSRPEDRPALEATLKRADVLVLTFDLARPETLERCGTHWMNELRQMRVQVPIILVGCKSDERGLDAELHQAIIGIVTANKQIEMCLECSAKNLQFTGEVFYYALKSVVNPIGPLFDPETGTIKPLCVRALKRVFMLSDRDKDHLLNDEELKAFQLHCFNAPLAPEELTAVKQVVADKVPQGITAEGALTFHGFLFLHALFIERGRTETPWAVLRAYGYDGFLKLSDEVLDRVPFRRGADQVVELTDAAFGFLEGVFAEHAGGRDGALTKAALDALFSTAPASPWTGRVYDRLLVATDGQGSLTLDGFLALWVYMTSREPRKTLAYLLYLGFEGDPGPLFSISKPRRQERRPDAPRRSVYECLVVGPPGCGKSGVLRGLVKPPPSATHRHRPSLPPRKQDSTEAAPLVAVGRVDPATGSHGSGRSWLVLRELDEAATAGLLASPSVEEALARADVGAFVFDGTNESSFRAAAAAMEAVAMASKDQLPCVFVAAKDDLGMPAELVTSAADVCGDFGIQPPLAASSKTPDMGPLFEQLLAAAVDGVVPATPSLKAQRKFRRLMRRVLLVGAAGGLGAGLLYAAYRLYNAPAEGASGGEVAAQEAPLGDGGVEVAVQ